METIVHNIRDLSGVERSAVERLVGQGVGENQQVVIQVVTLGAEAPEVLAPQGSSAAAIQLPDYCNVFDGLSDEELAELESRILDRSPSRSTP